MGFQSSGLPNLKTIQQKPSIPSISAPGILFTEATNGINSIRLMVDSAGPSNVIQLEGSLDGMVWANIGAITGNNSIIFSTQAYDFVRATTTNYGGTPFKFAWKLETHPSAFGVVDSGNDELNVNPDGSINVNIISGAGTAGTPIYTEAANSMTSLAYATVFSFTAINANTKIIKLECTAETTSNFQLYLDGSLIMERRSTPQERNVTFKFEQSRSLPLTKVIEVKAQPERMFAASYGTFVSMEGFYT